MSRRARLPGADELFRRTAREREPARHEPPPARHEPPPARQEPAPARQERAPARPERHEEKSTTLQVAEETAAVDARRGPKHDEKVTFYCTGDDLMALERARLRLRSEHGVAADRGRIVRAALAYVLEDFDARGDDSVLLRKLSD